jgi:hypothetical protein
VTFKLIDDRADGGAAQAAGDARPDARDEQPGAVTNGAPEGTSGARPPFPWRTTAAMALFVVLANAMNVLTALHDLGGRVSAWEPVVWETSSAVLVILLLPGVAALARAAPFERGRLLRFALVHAAGTVGFCLIHVGGFVAIRKLVYASFGHRYDFGGFGELVYEYRKDFISYGLLLIVFSLATRIGGARRPQPAPSAEPAPTFDIRDGQRLIRAKVGEIVSARSAGNYVEFHLADGRKPLMRATLSAVEQALAGQGFVRTHRSWLVNRGRVRALSPEGSGDWRVELDGGGFAPLSRRFPDALETLRRSA